jgi:hypothetical protein
MINELEVKMSKYGQFPRHELISMGLVSPFTGHSHNLNKTTEGNPKSI